jgi:hypothetical protein
MSRMTDDHSTDRVSRHEVVIHHWIPWARAEHLAPLLSNPGSDDTVTFRTSECSVPFTLTVREPAAGADGGYAIEGLPDECPLCQRPFRPWELHRINSIAISLHFLRTEPATPALPCDVILDA